MKRVNTHPQKICAGTRQVGSGGPWQSSHNTHGTVTEVAAFIHSTNHACS